MKKQITIDIYTKESIKIGDKVKIIDGSGLTFKEKINHPVYIVDSYPNLTGSEKKLEELVFTVTKNNIKNLACLSPTRDSAYLQDIEIDFQGKKFYTASKFVKVLPLKLFNYNNSTNKIWCTFDCGSVEAYDEEDAREKAIEIIKYNLKKVNDVLENSDIAQGFVLEMSFDDLKISYLHNI